MEEKDFVSTIASLGGLSLLAAAARSCMSAEKRSLTGILRGSVMALFVGALTAMFIQQFSFTLPMQGGIIGLASFIADDILLMILKVSKAVTERPAVIIEWILRK